MLPEDHPRRIELNDEVHARPPEALRAPVRISYVALLAEAGQGPDWVGHVRALAERFGTEPPAPDSSHFSADLGPFRLKWERHTEFVRFKFIVSGVAGEDPFAEPAIDAVPADWLAGLSGTVLVAVHVAMLPAPEGAPDVDAISAQLFDGNVLVGADVAGGAAVALTDFRVRADRFTRILVLDRATSPRQAGRVVQRLVEIDTYRMMALMALPVARDLAAFLARRERELSEITSALVGAGEADEPVLLDRLTKLEAEIESRQSTNLFRFSASDAYHDIVRRRIDELREERLAGLQTFREFMDRRLAPAMATSRATAARQESLATRAQRTTQLLSTRVDVTRERQNQAVLASMDRRAKLQLQLQETVEGLSVAALTYYIVGLVGYAAKGLYSLGFKVSTEAVMAGSIPVVLLLVALGIRRIRRSVSHD